MLEHKPEDAGAVDPLLAVDAMLARLPEIGRAARHLPAFHAELLRELVETLALPGGVVWLRSGQSAGGAVTAACQINPDAAWLSSDVDSRQLHATTVPAIFQTRRPLVVPAQSHDGTLVNPTPLSLFFQPLGGNGQVEAVLELFQEPLSERELTHEGMLGLLAATADVVKEVYLAAQVADLERQNQRLSQLHSFNESIFRSEHLDEVAVTIVNEARRVIDADRVLLLQCRARRCRLLAVSGTDTIERRAESVRRVERLAEAILPYGPVRYPSATDDLPPQIESPLSLYLEECDAASLILLPLTTSAANSSTAEPESDRIQPVGVLSVEWFHRPPADDALQRVEAITRAVSLALWKASQVDRLPFLPLMRLLRNLGWERRASVLGKLAQAGIVIAIIVLLLFAIPTRFHVRASGRIEPQRRAEIFAPLDGIVVDIPAATRQHVREGDVLAVLRSPELDRQYNDLLGQLRTVEEALATAKANRLRLDRDSESTTLQQLAGQIAELVAQQQGLQNQLKILQQQQEALTLRSPLDGEVVTWDLQPLATRPVNHGEALMQIADTSGPWQLDLDLPEHAVGHVIDAQQDNDAPLRVTYLLAGAPAQAHTGQLVRLARTTHVTAEGATALRALVSVERPADVLLRPDVTVHARIDCGRRSLAYVWFHRLWEAILLYR